jgi:RNA polymerase sigma-70 factor (ECF subfamily)
VDPTPAPLDPPPPASLTRRPAVLRPPLTFTDIYAAEARWVWRALWRLGVPERDLEDVAHDVFVVVYRKLADYDRDRPLRPWLFGICFRTALDRRRKAATTRESLGAADDHADVAADGADATDATAVIARKQKAALVHAALATLPLEQRAVVVLHELEGIAVADCVAVLDAPLNTLYSRLRLGRTAFARAIARLAPNDGSVP